MCSNVGLSCLITETIDEMFLILWVGHIYLVILLLQVIFIQEIEVMPYNCFSCPNTVWNPKNVHILSNVQVEEAGISSFF